MAGKTITANDGWITVTAWDVTLDGGLTAGTATINIHGSQPSQTMGLGATGKDITLDALEVQRMTAYGGFRLGGSASGSITVNGIANANSAGLHSIVSIVASADNKLVSFLSAPSTFHTLATQADNGVIVGVDV